VHKITAWRGNGPIKGDFFGDSIVRWRKLQNAVSDEVMAGLRNLSSTVTLKTLNPTRFASRRDAIFALKERLPRVLKCLTEIILISKKSPEVAVSIGLKKKIESFEFIFLLILQDKILQIVNIPSKSLQSVTMDLFTARDLLKTALADVSGLRNKFPDLKLEASALCQKLDIDDQFPEKRNRQAKRHFDELAVDHRFSDPEELFRIKTFLPMIDTVVTQLDTRFE